MALSGRSAIITGANQGLGQAIAGRFVRAGASVLLVARGEERLRQVEAELREHRAAGTDRRQPCGRCVAAGGLSSHCHSCAASVARA